MRPDLHDALRRLTARLAGPRPAAPIGREHQDRVVPLVPPGVWTEDDRLARLAAELESAGRTARADTAAGPDVAFAAGLRARLLDELAADGAVAAGSAAPSLTGSRATVEPMPGIGRPIVSTSWRGGPLLPSRRTIGVGLAAVLVVGLIGIATTRPSADAPTASVVAATAAYLERDGTEATLAEGGDLRAGDVVRVGPGGTATIAIDRGETRLAAGATLVVRALEPSLVDLEQLTGRVWHRVAVPGGATYRVTTAATAWSALGTAFDLAVDAEAITGVGIEGSVRVGGPDLATTLGAGRTIRLDRRSDGWSTAAATSDQLLDPWVRSNGTRDLALGFDIGILTALEPSPSTRPEPTVATEPTPTEPAPTSPSPEPSTASASPSPAPAAKPSPVVTPKPSPSPTLWPSPSPTLKPTPEPTPTPDRTLGELALALTACPGGTVLDWSAFGGEGFHHYAVVRGSSSFVAPEAYPPPAPLVTVDGTFTKDRTVTEAVDSGVAPGATAWYRALAFSIDDRVIAASPAQSATAKPTKSLGPLTAAAPGAGSVELGWVPFGGSAGCFSYYKVVWSTSTATPDYLGSHDGALPLAEQGAAGVALDGLASGGTWFRVQAIRATTLGKVVVAQTEVAFVEVP